MDWGCIQKVEMTRFVNGLNVIHEGKVVLQNDFWILTLSH